MTKNKRHRLSLGAIVLYQRWISPLLPASCRFAPTCSEYALECFRRYSWFKALFLALRRIMKCHPYHPGGLDPLK